MKRYVVVVGQVTNLMRLMSILSGLSDGQVLPTTFPLTDEEWTMEQMGGWAVRQLYRMYDTGNDASKAILADMWCPLATGSRRLFPVAQILATRPDLVGADNEILDAFLGAHLLNDEATVVAVVASQQALNSGRPLRIDTMWRDRLPTRTPFYVQRDDRKIVELAALR